MWARVVEVMLAIWLLISPFIFRHPTHETFLWVNDFICGSLVAVFALFSFWHPLRKIHLMTLGVALWLWGLGYTSFPEMTPPSQENSVVIGLILLMLAIIPSHSHHTTLSWKEFINRKEK